MLEQLRRVMGFGYMDQAGDTQAGGGGGDTQTGGAGNDTQKGGNDTQAGGGQDTMDGGGKTLLQNLGEGKVDDKGQKKVDETKLTDEQKAAKAALEASEKDSRRPKDVPAKYWDATKGEVNFTAWAKSTTELETRMRTTGLPPKSADEYKVEIPPELKAAGVDLDPAQSKAFREMALAAGLTQKQYETVMGAYFKNLGEAADQTSQFSQDKCRTELLKTYKTDEALVAANQRAYRTFMAFADEGDREAIDSIGNIPAVIRMLDKVGKEMGEDKGVHPDAILDQESLQTLMRGGPGKEDSPYWNESDPRHAATKAKVTAHHQAEEARKRRQQG